MYLIILKMAILMKICFLFFFIFEKATFLHISLYITGKIIFIRIALMLNIQNLKILQ